MSAVTPPPSNMPRANLPAVEVIEGDSWNDDQYPEHWNLGSQAPAKSLLDEDYFNARVHRRPRRFN